MGFIAFLILGLIAGAIAKAILPGRQGGGWVITLVLGVVGALLGGWIGGMIFGTGLQEFFSLKTWLLAIGGALIVLLVYGMITKRGVRGSPATCARKPARGHYPRPVFYSPGLVAGVENLHGAGVHCEIKTSFGCRNCHRVCPRLAVRPGCL